jgi:diguanylate cyclase (GGDEF)-like protein
MEKKPAVAFEKLLQAISFGNTEEAVITSIAGRLARMEHRVAYDPLLHIYNRSYCSRIISEQSSVNTAPPLAVAMIDIDHFKKVNDTHGHQVGDQVLYNTAQAVCREVVPDGVVCRYGGEELIVFFPRKTAKEIVNIMERVRSSVEKVKTAAPRRKIKVTLSCGISCRTDMSQSVIDVIHTADKALYRAKKGGRNRTKSARTRAGATKRGAQRRGS